MQTDSNDELPDLTSLITARKSNKMPTSSSLRRSPRKHNVKKFSTTEQVLRESMCTSIHTEHANPESPASTVSPQRRSPLKTLPQQQSSKPQLGCIPLLPRYDNRNMVTAYASQRRSPTNALKKPQTQQDDSLLGSIAKLTIKNISDTDSDPSLLQLKSKRALKKPSVMSLMTEAARLPQRSNTAANIVKAKIMTKPKLGSQASRFILGEARCNEDLADSDADNDGEEEEETDLSGFVVDDDAELSYHESMESEPDSEEERRERRQAIQTKPKSRRRLQRGRRNIAESEDEFPPTNNDDEDLASALGEMAINDAKLQPQSNRKIEVIDLTSPAREAKPERPEALDTKAHTSEDLFTAFKNLRLSPPRRDEQCSIIGGKAEDRSLCSNNGTHSEDDFVGEDNKKYTTPPATPPRSPTKLKSPSKLLSPSKRTQAAPRSPHRPSLDAFWDHNVVNEFNDQYSPKKAPLMSPRKLLDRFHLWSDSEGEGSMVEPDQSSDSLPSPCESPSKTRNSPIKSPEKLQRQKARQDKKAELDRKRAFEKNRDQLARELLEALDKNVTQSRISDMTASTGGIKVIWSKTLRSTAGRAQWRRSVRKATGSPIKGATPLDEKAAGTIIEHFAKIELATKIIDRPERLISTLTHEFCHLANYMISGICDQPHGKSFNSWGRKCTQWLQKESGRPEWRNAEVATKHNYEIDFKYLWVCVGRDRTMAMTVLNLADDEGCGAEYGRHSKSLDTDKHRCGRCKGKLVQVRPKPRPSPKKQLPLRNVKVERNNFLKMQVLEKTVEVIELSD